MKQFPTDEHFGGRALRVVIGLAGLSPAFSGPWRLWAYLALTPVATDLNGSCPLYTLFGISTWPVSGR